MESKSEQFVSQFVKASLVGIPIVGISTSDQRATIQKLSKAISEADKSKNAFAFLGWNCADGVFQSLPEGTPDKYVTKTAETKAIIHSAIDDTDDPILQDFTEMVTVVRKHTPDRTIVFAQNSHLFLSDNSAIQTVWNLRDDFKNNRRMLVLLAPEFKSPAELKDDIIVLDDPLPTEQEISSQIVSKVEEAVQQKFDNEVKELCIDSVLGLSAFAAEQAMFLSLKREGTKVNVDLDRLRHVKRTLIRQTPGLRISEAKFRFSDIGGVQTIKENMKEIIGGRRPPKLIVFIDEFEKALAGSNSNGAGDTSGVSQDILGQMLQHMENTRARGVIFVGPPGTSKTMVAKAIGNEAGVDTVEFDLGGVKESLVGSTERNIRQALKVIEGCSRGCSYWVATSNNLTVIPPELRRRFTDGVFFFDLPTNEEREKIWDIQIKANNLTKNQVDKINDHEWTGAEIRNCCAMAYDRNKKLSQVAKFVNPVAVSSAALIRRLRKESSGCFLSASKDGYYKYEEQQVAQPQMAPTRSIDLSNN